VSFEPGELCNVPAENLIEPGEDLRHGMWPRSLALWMAATWIALFLIRPWEKLFPGLAEIHFARVYALSMIAVVVCSGNLRLEISSKTFGVLGFAFTLCVSWMAAWRPLLAWEMIYEYFTLLAFYFVLLSTIRTPYGLVFVAASYIVVMAMYLGKAQVEFFFFGENWYDQGVKRMVGIETTYGGPNAVAESTMLSMPILAFLWRNRIQFTQIWPNGWRKWFSRGLVFYLWLAVTSILLTNSRTGMISFAFFLVLLSLSGKQLGRTVVCLLVAILVTAAIWVVMPQEQKGRLRTVWDPDSGPANSQASA
jgi:hypothetical protein